MASDALPPEIKDELRLALEEERDRVRERLRDLDAEEDALVRNEVAEIAEGGIGSGMADALASLSERETDMAAERLLERRLDEIATALARMEAGSYGLCKNCGRPIAIERLRAVPWATQCVDCAARLRSRSRT
jgi:DnaK suppressor protein